MEPRYYHHVVGINSRLDTIQAAVLNVKMPHLEPWARQRETNALDYHSLFAEYGLDKVLTLPQTARAARHVWNQYTIRVPDGRRDELRKHLTAAKIGTEIYYPVPLHEQACFASLGYKLGSLPETERAAREVLALPIFPELTSDEQQTVVASIAGYFGVSQSEATGEVVPIARPKFLETRPAKKAG
jgi:dTDP-4-amino-4,6-dideoxygalactose transaminase